MTNPYPQPARQLERSRRDRILGGVCGGVANYLNMDATLVRILTVVLTLFTGVPIVIYLVALFVMPEEPLSPEPPPVGPGHQATSAGDPVWGPAGAPWEQQPVRDGQHAKAD